MITIPGYEIRKELGRGGMATVYLAEQSSFERQVALKVMSKAFVSDKTFCDRFLREAKIVAQVSHPNIVAVYDVGEHEGNYYIAMEYHPNGDLKDQIRSSLSILECIRIASDIAKALDFAHSKGFIHRDIKPDNVLFAHDGRAILTDFGIAKAHNQDTQLTQLGTVAGTPKYMSPEQARGQQLDSDSDLYSLGIMFYEMLIGEVPFNAADPIATGIMHLKDPIPELPGELAQFQAFLDKLCAKIPAQRHQSGTEIIRDLEAIKTNITGADLSDSDGATVFRSAIDNTSKQNKSSKGMAITALALAVLVLAGGAGFVVLNGNLISTGNTNHNNPLLPTEGVTAENDLQAEIPKLYAKAELAMQDDRLTSPQGNNAFESYVQILAIDPNHQPSRDGIRRISDRYIALAKTAWSNKRPNEAKSYFKKSEKMDPYNPNLVVIRAQIARKSANKKPLKNVPSNNYRDQLRIAGLMRGAENATKENNSELAKEKYREVIKIDPQNIPAKKALVSLN